VFFVFVELESLVTQFKNDVINFSYQSKTKTIKHLRTLDHHIQISFKSRCEIIPQTPAWAYKYECIWKINVSK